MSTKVKTAAVKSKEAISKECVSGGGPRCRTVSSVGIQTAGQFAKFMSFMITDLIDGAITPQVGNAAVNAGGKLLKVVEMQYKYGKTGPDGVRKTLDLIGDEAA